MHFNINLVFIAIVVIAIVGSVIKNLLGELVRMGKAYQDKTSSATDELIQRELEKMIRRQDVAPAAPRPVPAPPAAKPSLARMAAQVAAPAARPAPSLAPPEPPIKVQPTMPPAPPPVPQPVVLNCEPGAVQAVRPRRAVSATAYAVRPRAAVTSAPVRGRGGAMRVNARVLGKAILLSEILRPPLALRDSAPWERT